MEVSSQCHALAALPQGIEIYIARNRFLSDPSLHQLRIPDHLSFYHVTFASLSLGIIFHLVLFEVVEKEIWGTSHVGY
jgi:hypothetical protein